MIPHAARFSAGLVRRFVSLLFAITVVTNARMFHFFSNTTRISDFCPDQFSGPRRSFGGVCRVDSDGPGCTPGLTTALSVAHRPRRVYRRRTSHCIKTQNADLFFIKIIGFFKFFQKKSIFYLHFFKTLELFRGIHDFCADFVASERGVLW